MKKFKEDDLHAKLAKDLLRWYSANSRTLPWRGGTPYQVWVSEIMCQQTKVDTVVPYFIRWMEAFPTVQDLALASLDDVNKVWAGLGYYRRAKFLHEGAKFVVDNFNGELPTTKHELLKISGIGAYTAGAISSICFKNKDSAVDGNVLRVTSRILALELETKDKSLFKEADEFALQLLRDIEDEALPGDLNQALMELGALVCTPKKLKCSSTCPVAKHCLAYEKHNGDEEEIQQRYPAPKSTAIKPKPEHPVTACAIVSETLGVLAMKRADDGGVLAGQWELVCGTSSAEVLRLLKQLGVCPKCCAKQKALHFDSFRHIFTHIVHVVYPMRINVDFSACKKCVLQANNGIKWIPHNELNAQGLTRSMTKTLEVCGLL